MPERSGNRLVPKNLQEFQQHFPNDEACIAHLYAKRFPAGFVCRYCKQHEIDAGPPYTFAGRPTVYRCRNCKRDTSLTAGTIMYRSKQPLYTWFWAAFLVTSLTPGMSAVQFKRRTRCSWAAPSRSCPDESQASGAGGIRTSWEAHYPRTAVGTDAAFSQADSGYKSFRTGSRKR